MTTALLALHEAIATAGPVREDGLVPLHIIRPGIGKGKGRHLYEASMLEREAKDGRFNGWKMYLDHQDPEAKKRAAGLPRSIRDLAGVVKEAWWDPSVPADPKLGYSQGAVVGLARVNRFVRSLVEDLGPDAIGASISAQATGVRPKVIGGQQVWLVEGIRPRGSVDFVTEAGAGGKVLEMLEALNESWTDEEETRQMLESLSTEELVELVKTERPDLLEALTTEGTNAEKEEPTVATAAELKEALESDEGRALIEAAVNQRIEEGVAPKLAELVENALEEERTLMQAELQAVTDRRELVRDLRDSAHKAINESKLPEPMKVELRDKYEIVDKTPTPALDVMDVKENEEVVKKAEDVLRESVEADITAKRAQVAAIRPTHVHGQGPAAEKATTAPALNEGEKTEEAKKPTTTGSPLTDSLLMESKFEGEELGDIYADIT